MSRKNERQVQPTFVGPSCSSPPSQYRPPRPTHQTMPRIKNPPCRASGNGVVVTIASGHYPNEIPGGGAPVVVKRVEGVLSLSSEIRFARLMSTGLASGSGNEAHGPNDTPIPTQLGAHPSFSSARRPSLASSAADAEGDQTEDSRRRHLPVMHSPQPQRLISRAAEGIRHNTASVLATPSKKRKPHPTSWSEKIPRSPSQRAPASTAATGLHAKPKHVYWQPPAAVRLPRPHPSTPITSIAAPDRACD
ncbi:uncharacterized protein EV422DRAFT_510926 [Fimicolochytrium jonesii]|uniref:uncharacterized protein n=1 Tax=Fimicolochytrium jonesii TaxID=1396493 RepID=UPI0022FE3F15|nr:uncharacterized protein EV422DRAFT_510926 [Fimicolochytrium jonesii]KAI8826639.1 hypothetical protein EV422DRAFT_510926 [Fimicolochytrium jonesii]